MLFFVRVRLSMFEVIFQPHRKSIKVSYFLIKLICNCTSRSCFDINYCWKAANMILLAEFSNFWPFNKQEFDICFILVFFIKQIPIRLEFDAVGTALHVEIHDKVCLRLFMRQVLKLVVGKNVYAFAICPPTFIC